MIARIELENFMSHKRTVLELAKGLTVLVGPNNCGKSAVVTALQIVCENSHGDYMVRHGEKECRVVLVTDDGHRVEWKRHGAVVSYSLDGQEIHRLRGDIPDELHALLRLPKVTAADNREPYDIHFGLQKSPIFLLNEPGSRAATFFAASSDAAKLIEMQVRHRDKVRQATIDERRLNEEAEKLRRQLNILSPIEDLQRRSDQSKNDHAEILSLFVKLDSMKGIRKLLGRRLAVTEHWKSHVTALMSLVTPPLVEDVAPLRGLIDRTEITAKSAAFGQDCTERLLPLNPPPQMADTSTLFRLVTGLANASGERRLSSELGVTLVELESPPVLANIEVLANLCRRLERTEKATVALARQQSCLTLLQKAPIQKDLLRLASLIGGLTFAVDHVAVADAKRHALTSVSKPPAIANIDVLAKTVQMIAVAEESCRWRRILRDTFRRLPTIPSVKDCNPLETLVGAIAKINLEIAECKKALDLADRNLTKSANALRFWVTANRVCPICGGEMDAERVVENAGSGLGDHGHARR